MSRYDVPDPEDLFECPYDNTHMVRAKRMQYHLMKCRRNYTGADYAVCPFNARHEMPRPELRFHIAHCKHRVVLEQDIIFAQQKLEKQNDLTSLDYKSDWEPPRSSEDWERDIPVIPRIGLDPNFLKDKNIIRNLTGMTPAQKKAFHMRALQNYERQQQGLPPLEEDPVESGDSRVTGVNGLRLPREEPLILRQMQQQQKQQRMKPAVQQHPSVFVHSLAMAGIGRGRTASSISSISLPKPGSSLDSRKAKPAFVVPKTSCSPVEDKAMSGEDSNNSSEDSDEVKKKEVRKLNKKLREIYVLEAKKMAGLSLSADENNKVQCKAEIVRRILDLA